MVSFRCRRRRPSGRNVLVSLFLSFLVWSETQAWSPSRLDLVRVGPVGRRDAFIACAGIAVAGLAVTSHPNPAYAATATTAGEAVRRSAANLPGYGPSDVFYPASWKGTWNMRREVVATDATVASVLEYTVRFIPSVQDDAVIADRGFNQANLEAAIHRSASETGNVNGTADLQSVAWTETNPNDLRLVFANGTFKEIKVTKRATTEITASTVSSSEFQRVTQEDARGIPVIAARRVLSKWKMNENGVVVGLELAYDVGGGGDPLSATFPSSDTPTLLSKSRLRLER